MADPSYLRLHLGNLDQVRVTVVLNPWPSALVLLINVVAGRDRDVVEPLRQAIAGVLTAPSVAAATPLAWPGSSAGPDCLLPIQALRDQEIHTGLDYLRTFPAESLVAELEAQFGAAPPPKQWRPVLLKPREWLHAYADAMEQTWSGLAAAWCLTKPLLEREVDRIGAAAVSGVLDLVLSSLDPRAKLVGNVLQLPHSEPTDHHLGCRRLVLAPMISGRFEGYVANVDLPDEVWIGYSLPGHRAALATVGAWGATPNGDRLRTVLGPLRANLLRSLAHPIAMGDLAGRLGCTPSRLTYHCDRLIAAGLIHRQRRGRVIYVIRSARGNALLELLC